VPVRVATDKEWREQVGATAALPRRAFTSPPTTGSTGIWQQTSPPTTTSGQINMGMNIQQTWTNAQTGANFVAYPNYAAFQQAQQKAMIEVAAHLQAEAKRKREEAEKRAKEAGIILPSPGQTFMDLGQMRPAYDLENEPDSQEE